MKKVTRKVKQAISILLVAAMVITMVPQAALSVSAEEAVETVTETETVDTTVTDTTDETKPDAGTVDETEASAEDEDADAEESEEEEADVETDETDTEDAVDEKTEATEDEKSEEGLKKELNDVEPMAEGVNTVEYVCDEKQVTLVKGSESTSTDTAYTFTATAKDTFKIDSVEAFYNYQSEEAENLETKIDVTDSGNGSYEIATEQFSALADKTITIVITSSKETFDVTFAGDGLTDVEIVTLDAESKETALPETNKVTVDSGDSLKFKVALTDAAVQAGKKLDEVKVDGAESALEASDGVYTYAPTAATTINVTTKNTVTYKVTFSATNTEVKQVINDGTTISLSDALGTETTVDEGEDFAFTVLPKEGSVYKVDSVSAAGVESINLPSSTVKIGETDYTVYTLSDVQEAITVTVEETLDPDKANCLKLEVDGNAAGVTVTVDGEEIANGEKALTAKGSVPVNVTAATGYTVTNVELIGGDIYESLILRDGSVTISFIDIRELTLKVTLGGAATEYDGVFTFNNKADHMTYSVPADQTGVTKKAGSTNLYQIAKGTTEVVFDVTATGKYTPVVTIGGEEQKGNVKTPTANGKTVYEYKVSAAVFDGSEGIGTIVIDEEAEKKVLTVKFNDDEVKVSATLAGREYEPTSGETFDETKVLEYEVNTDSSLVLTVTPFTNCQITGATTQTGTAAAKKASVKATGASLTVKVTDDTVVNISSEGLYKAYLVSEEDHQWLEATKGIYAVDYDGTYTTGVTYGVEASVKLSKVTVMDGNKAAATVAEIAEDDYSATLAIDAKDAGKTLTVTLYSKVDEQEKAVSTYKMKVSTALTGVKIAGVKNDALTQTVDTTAEYAITATTKTADLSRLKAESSNEGLVEAKVVDGKLKITTKIPDDETKSAKVKLYEGEAEAKKQIGNDITVNIADPAWTTAAPTVKVKSTDDTSVTLTLTAPKNVVTPNTGKLYYKVEVTPRDRERAPEYGDEIVTEYIEKAEGASQDATITVNTAGSGSGAKWKYDAVVTLVQTKDKNEAVTSEGNVIYTSKASKAVTAETKTPAYETKLTLKKGTTTLYRGQQNVKVATVQFSKNTTHTNIDGIDPIEGWVYDGSWSEEEIITFSYSNGNIYATVADMDIEPGIYTRTVYAEAPAGVVPASAKLQITIASGIASIDVEVPSTSIYKADKKAATLKVTPVFNSASEFSTKAKKVNYEILDKDENELTESNRLYGMVTVKNGTVTVNKNYVVAADADENTFCVKVTAADYEGNPAYGISAPITITSEAQKLGEVCIIKYNSATHKYDVVTRGDKTLTKEDLEGAIVAVLKKGTEEKSAYVWADFVDPYYLTYKSSNKAVSFDGLGRITVNGTAKNVKITVSTNDGGKQSAVLDKLTIGNTEVERLGIWANQYTSTGTVVEYLNGNVANQLPGGDAFIAGDEIHFSGTADSVIQLKIDAVDANRKWVSDGYKGLINYKVKVDNGGKLLSSSNGFANVALSKKSAVVTLEYKVGKETKKDKFTIVNDAFVDKNAPTVKVSGGILSRRDIDQKVTFTLSGDYDFTDKYVLAEVDPSIYYGKTYYGKTWWVAGQIANACDGINKPIPVTVEDGKASFTLTFYENYGIDPGSYKLQLTFGTNNGNFVPDTKAVTTTLKVTQSKVNGSYKPVTKVTLSAKDQPAVELKGTGKNISYQVYYDLCNVMNTNGQPNEFTKYFELDEETNTLKIRDDVDVSDIKKEDLTGYVSYYAEFGEETYTDYTKGTVKITVTLKDTFVNKYSVSANTITVDENNKAVVEFKANGKPFDVAFVGSDIKTNGLNICEEDITDNKLTYTLCDTKKGNYKVDLYMVPANSHYCDKFDEIDPNTEEGYQEWLAATKKYGTKFTITIKVNEDIIVQTPEEAKAAAEAAIANLEVSNDTESDDVLNAVKAVIDTSIYDAEWNENDPFWKGKTSIQGTIYIIRRADDEIVGRISVHKTITTTDDAGT